MKTKKMVNDSPPTDDAIGALKHALSEKEQNLYALRLYVSGMTPNSLMAIRNLREICTEHLEGRYQLDIIDIYQQPHLAKEQQIIAVPALVRLLPLPLRTFIGDMSQRDKIISGLDIKRNS